MEQDQSPGYTVPLSGDPGQLKKSVCRAMHACGIVVWCQEGIIHMYRCWGCTTKSDHHAGAQNRHGLQLHKCTLFPCIF